MPDKTQHKPRSRPKKPWAPPRVKTGHLFESNSLSCGKTYPPMDEQCAGQAATNS